MQPKISIITITFNAQRYVEDTIKSVIAQTYPNIEYLIVDGQSTDETVNIIKKYTSQITRWISEPDKGIADAMNKGLTLASGDFILFLHADDYLLHKQSITEAVQLMQGNFYIFAFTIFLQTKTGGFSAKPRSLNSYTRFKLPFRHQGVFCHRQLFQEIGTFDTQFKIAMDYDFFLRAYWKKYPAKTIDYTVAVMRDTGISSRRDWRSLRERFAEEKAVHFKNCPHLFERLIYYSYWMLYLPYRWLRAKIFPA